MNSESQQVRDAILASKQIGTITPELAVLVHQIARRRCSPQLCDDVAQSVLLGILGHLGTIDPSKGDVYHFVCSCIVKAWQKACRSRRRERRYLMRTMQVLLDELPSCIRARARGQALASFGIVSRLKYY